MNIARGTVIAPGARVPNETVAKKLQRALIVCAAVNVAVVAWDLATGGIYVTVFGFVFSSWEIAKPIRYAGACLAVAIWLRDRDSAPTTWECIPQWSARGARAIALTSIIIAGFFGIRAAGGADAFGYVSQAQLWMEGRLIAPEPLTLGSDLGAAVAPLGYTLAMTPDAIVPTYPPGLPLLMASAQRLAGRQAVYIVVPLLGGLTVWMTYLIGLRMGDARAGVMAALLVAFSPLFLFHTLEPMSDVPATAWWTAAWAMSLAPGLWSAFGAGVATAAAIITRPNLAALAVVLAAVVAARPPRLRRAILFAAPMAAGCLVVGAFNRALFGSPFRSGYGPLEALFEWRHLRPNLMRYSRWMLDLHTPVLLLALLAPLTSRSWIVRLMCIFCAAVGLSYVFYLVFDHWPFARYLLPSLPLLFVLASTVLLRGLASLPLAWRGATMFTICVLLTAWYVGVADRLGVFAIQRAEQRYATVGQFVSRTLPRNAVVLSVIHSGSIRWHGDRLTVRWDALPADRLDPAIALLRASGYAPYILLEDWEEPIFRQQFARTNRFGTIDWPPALEYEGPGRARLYCVADRMRHADGLPVVTQPIAAP